MPMRIKQQRSHVPLHLLYSLHIVPLLFHKMMCFKQSPSTLLSCNNKDCAFNYPNVDPKAACLSSAQAIKRQMLCCMLAHISHFVHLKWKKTPNFIKEETRSSSFIHNQNLKPLLCHTGGAMTYNHCVLLVAVIYIVEQIKHLICVMCLLKCIACFVLYE